MYNKLSRDEKKRVRDGYAKTKKAQDLLANLNRLLAEGLFLLITTVVILVLIFKFKLAWWYWFFAGLTLFCGLIFLIVQYIIRIKEYNKFLVHDNKKRKK